LSKAGGEGFAHRVEVQFVPQSVHEIDLGPEQVAFDGAFKMLADFEHRLRFGRFQFADFFGEQWMQWDDGFLLVLGGAGAGEEVGARAFKVQVRSEQLPEFAYPQSGIDGGKIDEPPLECGNGKQPL